jgi:hypothetical protein
VKTVKIKVEIEADVPEGDYCFMCNGLSGSPTPGICFAFPGKKMVFNRIHGFKKCQQCLDACEKGK